VHVHEGAEPRPRGFREPTQPAYVFPSSEPFSRISAVELVPEYDPEPTEPAIFLRERAQAISDQHSRPAGRSSAHDEVPRHGHGHASSDDAAQLDEHSFEPDPAHELAPEHPQDFAANALAERLKRRRSSASSLVPHHITLPPAAAESGEPKPPTGGKRS
jgi:hypothetical protein